MKKVFMPLACAIAIVTIASCNDSATTGTATDSISATEGSATAGSMSQDGIGKTSYVDLNSGSSVEVKKDSITGRYINIQTNEPLEYYVDPSTADTFDMSGRVVNNAISRGPDGKYLTDEKKIKTADGKIKMQGDGDLKIKDGDTKMKVEKDGDLKIKTEDGKVKVKDGELKVKQ